MIVPILGLGQKGKSSTVSAQRHLNLYAEKSDDKAEIAFYGTPGTTLRVTFGDTPVRGWIAIGDLYYLVHRGTLYSVNNAGTKTILGTLNTTEGRVDMAYNGTVILMVDGTNGYTFTISGSSFAVVTDAQFPDAAKTVAWLAGQFIVDQGSGDVFQTSPDGTNWDALDFASAESNPDGLVRVFTDNGELHLAGENTWEFWGISANPDFAFASITGATGQFGLAARWSLCRFNGGIAALVKPQGQGQVEIRLVKGYQFQKISTQDLDTIINGYSTKSDATAFSYTLSGHPMYQINFPSANASWLFDASTGMWSPLEYGLSGDRHLAEMGLDYLNKIIVADYDNGNVYNLDVDAYTDNGTAIASEIITRHLFKGNKRIPVNQVYIDVQVGVGTVSVTDPQIMLQVSKDNGRTWGAERWTALGNVGKYLTRVVWRRLGVARDWLFKVRITDPVKRVFVFADVGDD